MGLVVGDVTRILSAIEQGEAQASEDLFLAVYDELRKLAGHRMSRESPDHTLQPTALVHEVYVRLVDVKTAQRWRSRGHFFGAAAEAMRRILVESARRKGRVKRGGELVRAPPELMDSVAGKDRKELLDVHEALGKLDESNPQAGRVVNLRYFAGFTNREAAELMGISPRKADQLWAYARAWLVDAIGGID
ncbi:MAG: ECF-type sigma factor [Planctomycetota bacterium]